MQCRIRNALQASPSRRQASERRMNGHEGQVEEQRSVLGVILEDTASLLKVNSTGLYQNNSIVTELKCLDKRDSLQLQFLATQKKPRKLKKKNCINLSSRTKILIICMFFFVNVGKNSVLLLIFFRQIEQVKSTCDNPNPQCPQDIFALKPAKRNKVLHNRGQEVELRHFCFFGQCFYEQPARSWVVHMDHT